MAKLTKKFLKENEFFLKGEKHKKIVYNKKCQRCLQDCKQSYKVKIIRCKNYIISKEL